MEYLHHINGPADVKALGIGELKELASEIRSAMLEKISLCGGHFGPNFGMVEATIALHYVFNSPKDKFVFDVSHQCYVHKILTGRKDAFLDEEHYKDVSGYTNPAESEHDFFNVGHTSTSVSLACGLAKARDLVGGTENIVAIIGDGSLSGGEAYEGLDNVGALGTNMIIVVNDNDMSIAENHGGLYPHLAKLRETNGQAENNIFKCLGFEYHYIDKGNEIEPLIKVFESVKDANHPVVIHIHTRKGCGFSLAEEDRENWHWRPAFYPETGETRRKMTGENYDNIVCDYLLAKMKKDPKVVALVAAVPLTIGFTKEKREQAGKQFVDVGIAEEHAVAMASGIARNGGKPVFATFSSFFQRTYDQISQDLCINKCPATLLVRNASVWGPNDVTHLGIFDIPMMSNIPNLVYLAPTNCEEYLSMLDWSIEQNKYPVAIRIPRNGVHHVTEKVDSDYSDLNKNLVTRKGGNIAVFALGDFYQLGEELCDHIEKEIGIAPTLVNPRYITGLDVDLLNSLKENHQVVLTMEDGVLDGGYGQKIASFYGPSAMKVMNYGLKKEFIDRFNASEILKENKITIEDMINDLKNII